MNYLGYGPEHGAGDGELDPLEAVDADHDLDEGVRRVSEEAAVITPNRMRSLSRSLVGFSRARLILPELAAAWRCREGWVGEWMVRW